MSYHVSEGWYGHGPHGSDLTSSTTELLYFAIRSSILFTQTLNNQKNTSYNMNSMTIFDYAKSFGTVCHPSIHHNY